MLKIKPGDSFGKLTAQWYWKRKEKKGMVWKCTCKCGGYCYVKSSSLEQGIVKNCERCREWKKELLELSTEEDSASYINHVEKASQGISEEMGNLSPGQHEN